MTVVDSVTGEEYLDTTVAIPGETRRYKFPGSAVQVVAFGDDVVDHYVNNARIEVDAFDPDMKPEPLRTFLSSDSGTFEDRDAMTTLFTCGNPGATEICVRATDGDRLAHLRHRSVAVSFVLIHPRQVH